MPVWPGHPARRPDSTGAQMRPVRGIAIMTAVAISILALTSTAASAQGSPPSAAGRAHDAARPGGPDFKECNGTFILSNVDVADGGAGTAQLSWTFSTFGEPVVLRVLQLTWRNVDTGAQDSFADVAPMSDTTYANTASAATGPGLVAFTVQGFIELSSMSICSFEGFAVASVSA